MIVSLIFGHPGYISSLVYVSASLAFFLVISHFTLFFTSSVWPGGQLIRLMQAGNFFGVFWLSFCDYRRVKMEPDSATVHAEKGILG